MMVARDGVEPPPPAFWELLRRGNWRFSAPEEPAVILLLPGRGKSWKPSRAACLRRRISALCSAVHPPICSNEGSVMKSTGFCGSYAYTGRDNRSPKRRLVLWDLHRCNEIWTSVRIYALSNISGFFKSITIILCGWPRNSATKSGRPHQKVATSQIQRQRILSKELRWC